MKYLLIPVFAFFLPLSAKAASFFGPIVPEACRACPCGFKGVMQIVQNLMNIGISFAILVCIIVLAAGGLMYILSSANPESRSKANKMLMNAFMGLLIVLSSWLIVDFVMKTLYGGDFGPWNTILLVGGEDCLVGKEKNTALYDGPQIGASAGLPGEGGAEEGGTDGGGGSNCPVPSASGMVAFPASATSGETERATPQTVENFLAMRAAALKEDVDLKVTDGYRPDSEQVALWNKYCGTKGCGATKVGKPCSMGGNGSNHNSGQALDIAVGCKNGSSGCASTAYKWLKANGSKWGFKNALPTDPVHWSPSGR